MEVSLHFIVPNVTPSNFEIDPDVPFTHESVGLMWDPVDTSDKAMQGKFNGYKVILFTKQCLKKIHMATIGNFKFAKIEIV